MWEAFPERPIDEDSDRKCLHVVKESMELLNDHVKNFIIVMTPNDRRLFRELARQHRGKILPGLKTGTWLGRGNLAHSNRWREIVRYGEEAAATVNATECYLDLETPYVEHLNGTHLVDPTSVANAIRETAGRSPINFGLYGLHYVLDHHFASGKIAIEVADAIKPKDWFAPGFLRSDRDWKGQSAARQYHAQITNGHQFREQLLVSMTGTRGRYTCFEPGGVLDFLASADDGKFIMNLPGADCLNCAKELVTHLKPQSLPTPAGWTVTHSFTAFERPQPRPLTAKEQPMFTIEFPPFDYNTSVTPKESGLISSYTPKIEAPGDLPQFLWARPHWRREGNKQVWMGTFPAFDPRTRKELGPYSALFILGVGSQYGIDAFEGQQDARMVAAAAAPMNPPMMPRTQDRIILGVREITLGMRGAVGEIITEIIGDPAIEGLTNQLWVQPIRHV